MKFSTTKIVIGNPYYHEDLDGDPANWRQGLPFLSDKCIRFLCKKYHRDDVDLRVNMEDVMQIGREGEAVALAKPDFRPTDRGALAFVMRNVQWQLCHIAQFANCAKRSPGYGVYESKRREAKKRGEKEPRFVRAGVLSMDIKVDGPDSDAQGDYLSIGKLMRAYSESQQSTDTEIAVVNGLAEVGDQERKAMLLKIAGVRKKEIEKIMGLSAFQVRERLRAARKAIRKKLETPCR